MIGRQFNGLRVIHRPQNSNFVILPSSLFIVEVDRTSFLRIVRRQVASERQRSESHFGDTGSCLRPSSEEGTSGAGDTEPGRREDLKRAAAIKLFTV